jgi:hypothetical protein
MKKLLLAAVALAASTTFASAVTVDDPLQGVCIGTTCTDNGSFTPITLAQQTGLWGFRAEAPGAGNPSGELNLYFLIPNNELAGFVMPTISGSANQAVLQAGLFTAANGTFQSYTGLSGNPNNPFDSIQGPSSLFDPGVTGFAVYKADAGFFSNICNCATPVDQFSLSAALPLGSSILGILQIPGDGNIFTAPSGQLLSVPGPAAGAGIPGVIAGCIALVGLARRRFKRTVA